MGGSLICREPTEPMLLEVYNDIKEILGRAGWMEYVLRLQGYKKGAGFENKSLPHPWDDFIFFVQ
jgi:hypothetical protein